MSNLTEPKGSGQNKITLEKHREYLKQISESEACPSHAKIAKIPSIASLEKDCQSVDLHEDDFVGDKKRTK